MQYLDEYDLAILKADTDYNGAATMYEMAELTYNQLCRKAEYKVLLEGGDADDLAFYYQEADEKSGDKKNIIVRIFEALKKFLHAVWTKIKEIFNKIKTKIMKFIHRNSINIGGLAKSVYDGRKRVLEGLDYTGNNLKYEEMEKTQATAIPSAADAVKAIYLRGKQGAAVAIKRPNDLQKIVAKFNKIAKDDGFINAKKADKIVESLNKDTIEPLNRKADYWESQAKNAGENVNTRGFKLIADIAREAATYAGAAASTINTESAKTAKEDSGAAKTDNNTENEIDEKKKEKAKNFMDKQKPTDEKKPDEDTEDEESEEDLYKQLKLFGSGATAREVNRRYGK